MVNKFLLLEESVMIVIVLILIRNRENSFAVLWYPRKEQDN